MRIHLYDLGDTPGRDSGLIYSREDRGVAQRNGLMELANLIAGVIGKRADRAERGVNPASPAIRTASPRARAERLPGNSRRSRLRHPGGAAHLIQVGPRAHSGDDCRVASRVRPALALPALDGFAGERLQALEQRVHFVIIAPHRARVAGASAGCPGDAISCVR